MSMMRFRWKLETWKELWKWDSKQFPYFKQPETSGQVHKTFLLIFWHLKSFKTLLEARRCFNKVQDFQSVSCSSVVVNQDDFCRQTHTPSETNFYCKFKILLSIAYRAFEAISMTSSPVLTQLDIFKHSTTVAIVGNFNAMDLKHVSALGLKIIKTNV